MRGVKKKSEATAGQKLKRDISRTVRVDWTFQLPFTVPQSSDRAFPAALCENHQGGETNRPKGMETCGVGTIRTANTLTPLPTKGSDGINSSREIKQTIKCYCKANDIMMKCIIEEQSRSCHASGSQDRIPAT